MDEREPSDIRAVRVARSEDESFFHTLLSRPLPAIEYDVTLALAGAFPNRALIETYGIDVESYAEAGHCSLARLAAPYPQVLTHWTGPDIPGMPSAWMDSEAEGEAPRHDTVDRVSIAWLEVSWQGVMLDVVVMSPVSEHRPPHYWILADREEMARGFLAAVSRWSMELRGEVLVFENGGWHKDANLFRALRGTSFGSVILRGSLKEDIRADAQRFFAAQATYDEYGIPWKRGILFVGPPGNGKTLMVKALISALSMPCLYVKNFRAPHGVDEISMRQVFDRARRMAPCVLVLEDLDAQVTPQNRSFFLNELDGFALNRGILTLATTNHPERLDASILDRPSRFDRKYHFDLPESPERQAYLSMWNNTLKPALRLSDEGIAAVAEQTEGFSFAYLKELGLSSMMAWIAAPGERAMDEIMASQVGALREQMVSAPPELDVDPSQVPMMQGMVRMHPMGPMRRFGPGMPGMPGVPGMG